MEYERNMYDDSDGIAVIYDRLSRQLFKQITWTTRGGDMHLDALEGVDKKPALFDLFGVRKAMVKHAYDTNKIFPGDTVEIVKGRKYPKGLIFKVDRCFDWKDDFGRIQTTYAVGKDANGKEIKTSITNCTLHKVTRFNRHLYLWNLREF
jgi:hypothetical protein